MPASIVTRTFHAVVIGNELVHKYTVLSNVIHDSGRVFWTDSLYEEQYTFQRDNNIHKLSAQNEWTNEVNRNDA